MVDSHFPGGELSALEPNHVLDEKSWEQVQCYQFLDASQTHLLGRIIWVPDWDFIPAKLRRHWGTYCLLRRKSALS